MALITFVGLCTQTDVLTGDVDARLSSAEECYEYAGVNGITDECCWR